MKKNAFHILLLLFLLPFASCSREKDDLLSDEAFYYMVTYTGGNEMDGSSFDLQIYEDSRHINLSAPDFFNPDLAPGSRLMLYYYVVGGNDDNRVVKLHGYAPVISNKLQSADKLQIAATGSNPLKLGSIWRSGTYINFSGQLQFTGKARNFSLVMDSATEHSATVDLYIVDDIKDAQGAFFRKAFASWNISELWNSPTCRSVRVWVNDINYPNVKYYEFRKQNDI